MKIVACRHPFSEPRLRKRKPTSEQRAGPFLVPALSRVLCGWLFRSHHKLAFRTHVCQGYSHFITATCVLFLNSADEESPEMLVGVSWSAGHSLASASSGGVGHWAWVGQVLGPPCGCGGCSLISSLGLLSSTCVCQKSRSPIDRWYYFNMTECQYDDDAVPVTGIYAWPW